MFFISRTSKDNPKMKRLLLCISIIAAIITQIQASPVPPDAPADVCMGHCIENMCSKCVPKYSDIDGKWVPMCMHDDAQPHCEIMPPNYYDNHEPGTSIGWWGHMRRQQNSVSDKTFLFSSKFCLINFGGVLMFSFRRMTHLCQNQGGRIPNSLLSAPGLYY